MNEQAIRFRIGIFVLAALILLGVLIILFGGLPNYFKSSTNYTISFANAQGISAGTPVKRSGVKIGEVSRSPCSITTPARSRSTFRWTRGSPCARAIGPRS